MGRTLKSHTRPAVRQVAVEMLSLAESSAKENLSSEVSEKSEMMVQTYSQHNVQLMTELGHSFDNEFTI